MQSPSKPRFLWRRWLPLIVVALAISLFFLLGFDKYFSFYTLHKHREDLTSFLLHNPVLTPLLFMLSYTLIVMLSIPIGGFVTMLAGFLFMQPLGTLYSLTAATLGAFFIFLLYKKAYTQQVPRKTGSFFHKMEKGFNRNSTSYLLFLRFVPIFPFWVINLAAAYFKVPTFTFFWTTLVGIIPGTFVYAQAGAGLGAIFENGTSFSWDKIFNWQMKLALLAIACLALLPIAVKKIRKKP